MVDNTSLKQVRKESEEESLENENIDHFDDGYDDYFDQFGPDSDAFKLRPKKSLSVAIHTEQKKKVPVLPRSNSHHDLHPNFVPRPRPKKNEVVVSPLKLYRKNFCKNASNQVISTYFPEGVDCNSEDEKFSLDGDNEKENNRETEAFTPEDESKLNSVRKEMVKIKNSQSPKKESNEYESILRIDELINEELNKKKKNPLKKKKSIFKKHITQMKEEKEFDLENDVDDYINLSGSGRMGRKHCSSVRTKTREQNKDGPKNFSLLGILESAVNDIHKNKRRKSLD